MVFCSYCDEIPKPIYLNTNGDPYCESCYNRICKTCNICRKYMCWICKQAYVCIYCDDCICIENSWDGTEEYHCRKCRSLKLEELYKYMVDKYHESKSLKELRNNILE